MVRPARPKTKAQMAADKITASVSVHNTRSTRSRQAQPTSERHTICKPWQREAYRHLNLCGEARAAVSLFAAGAARAEIGVSEPQTLARKAAWVNTGPEVDTFAMLAPTVRDRSKLIRDYVIHRMVGGECYLVARPRQVTDPEFDTKPDEPVWEIVGVTEMRRIGMGESETWSVRHSNGDYIEIPDDYPVVRFWDPDPEDRNEAWSPFRALLGTLKEIEWLTAHIFTQVRSRLMSAGVWFIPDNITYPPPPPSAVEGGAETLAQMNEAELFMASLAASGMQQLDADEVSFPTVVMADPAALDQIDQRKLIQFWSDIDDKAMLLRADAIRRFALGMDLPPEQILGMTGVAVSGSAGSAGSSSHWSIWAIEEQTIVTHIEPALDALVGDLTTSFLRTIIPGTKKVIGYDTTNLRLRQDRSKESIELYDRGVLSGDIVLRETGFDPKTDKMSDEEFKRWLLVKIAGGSATPEQVQESLRLLGVVLQADLSGSDKPATRQPGRNNPRSLDDHPYEGPPREDHEHKPAPYSRDSIKTVNGAKR